MYWPLEASSSHSHPMWFASFFYHLQELASSFLHAIGISEVLNFDVDCDFDPTSKVLLDSSRDRSLMVYGLCSYTFLVLLILSNKVMILRVGML